jgi:hypothetical protein
MPYKGLKPTFCPRSVLMWLCDVTPIPLAARLKAFVCRRSLVGVAGLNPADVMAVSLLCVLCVV